MEIKFTDAELETISAALDDYVYYDSEDLSEDEFINLTNVSSFNIN